MRVIVIADFAIPSGGAQRVAVESARALAESGARVTFLHAVAGSDPALDHPGIELICAGVPDVWSRDPLSAAINGVWSRQAADRARDRLAPLLPATWRHHRVDNPISVERAPPVEIGPDAAFAFVGRLTEDKGAIVAARAAAAAGARMIFIGDGPARAEIAAILPDATITGWVAPAEVASRLRARARAVLAPSLWPETGPLTVLEAAAMGLPAIVSERCGAAGKVDATTGAVVAPTVEANAAAMARLMDDAVVRAMGRAAHDRYWSNAPTPAAHATRLLALYGAMLSA